MKKSLHIFIIVVLMVLTVVAVFNRKPANKDNKYRVEKLFDNAGCSIYRFHDGGPVYYTVCTDHPKHSSSIPTEVVR